MKNFKSIKFLIITALVATISVGCDKEDAANTLKKAEDSAADVAKTVADDASKMADEGKKMASELGEKAMGFLNPLKEKLGNLEGLKETPEKLQAEVSQLLETMEQKAEGIELPEAVSTALATIKEKLVALKAYLAGEVEQAKIDEHIKGIMESAKSAFGGGE
jgi:uncharacterized coiled-coil DUF342 family protein